MEESQATFEQRAFVRLACALIGPDDDVEPSATIESVVSRFSAQDRTILTNVTRRLSEVGATKGVQAAEAALNDVVALLRRERGPFS